MQTIIWCLFGVISSLLAQAHSLSERQITQENQFNSAVGLPKGPEPQLSAIDDSTHNNGDDNNSNSNDLTYSDDQLNLENSLEIALTGGPLQKIDDSMNDIAPGASGEFAPVTPSRGGGPGGYTPYTSPGGYTPEQSIPSSGGYIPGPGGNLNPGAYGPNPPAPNKPGTIEGTGSAPGHSHSHPPLPISEPELTTILREWRERDCPSPKPTANWLTNIPRKGDWCKKPKHTSWGKWGRQLTPDMIYRKAVCCYGPNFGDWTEILGCIPLLGASVIF